MGPGLRGCHYEALARVDGRSGTWLEERMVMWLEESEGLEK